VIEEEQDRIHSDAFSSLKMKEETFVLFRDFIYSRTGIFFSEKKKYLLEGRVAKRLKLLGISSFEDYLHLLKFDEKKEKEFGFLCNTITINETSFFRSEPQITAFYKKLASEILEAKRASGMKTMRIWSAACSSGEEPYTLAILYLEHLKSRFSDVRIEIIGSDINTAMLELAREGEYNKYAVRSIPEYYLTKYFECIDGIYKLKGKVKDLVKFEYHNLTDRQEMRRMMNFDFIYCANVLIYFDHKSKTQVVGDLYNSLNHGGYLFIGSSEMLHGISSAFKLVSIPKATVYKKE
jgi:chemotaxis protein methyltransferase CheR